MWCKNVMNAPKFYAALPPYFIHECRSLGIAVSLVVSAILILWVTLLGECSEHLDTLSLVLPTNNLNEALKIIMLAYGFDISSNDQKNYVVKSVNE